MINLARHMALKSVSKFRLGAVLVKKNRVISAGYNQMNKSHPIMQKYSDTDFTLGLHAEVHSCIGVSANDLHASELWVCRLHKNEEFAMARPCLTCQKFLIDIGVKKVYFTNLEGKIECLVF